MSCSDVSHRTDEKQLGPLDVRRLLTDGVAATIDYVSRFSPFYRDRFGPALPLQSLDDLQRLPFTTKQDVSDGGRLFWCVKPGRVVDICTTSGTTGVPLLYPLVCEDIARLGYNEHLSFACAGLTPNDTVLLAVTMARCFMAGLAYFEGLTDLGATVVRVGSGSPAMVLSLLEALSATAIVSVPSFLKRIAQYAAENNIDLAEAPVRKLICIGEPVRNQDFSLNPLGCKVSELWRAPVFSTYAATELAASLCECEAGCGGHLHPELLHLEVVDDDGNPLPDGQVGELVATTIGVQAMPLVRYRTGDCAVMTTAQCACGRWTPRVGPIVCRRNQMLKIKGTTVYPAAVQRTLDSFEQVVNYVMIATSSSELSDQLQVLVAAEHDEPGLDMRIREQLRGDLKVTPEVRIVSADVIEEFQESGSLRKKRVFIDKRSTSGQTSSGSFGSDV